MVLQDIIHSIQTAYPQAEQILSHYAALPTITYVTARVALPLLGGAKLSENGKAHSIAGLAALAATGLQASSYAVEISPQLEQASAYIGAIGAGAIANGLLQAGKSAFKGNTSDKVRDAFNKGTSKGALYGPLVLLALEYIQK